MFVGVLEGKGLLIAGTRRWGALHPLPPNFWISRDR